LFLSGKYHKKEVTQQRKNRFDISEVRRSGLKESARKTYKHFRDVVDSRTDVLQ